jgi:hypothetical protein
MDTDNYDAMEEKYDALKQFLLKRLIGKTVSIDESFDADAALNQVGWRPEDLERIEPVHLDLRVSAQPLLDEGSGEIYWQFEIVGPEE